FRRKLNQAESVQVDGNSAVCAAGFEAESGVVRCRPGDDRIAVLNGAGDLFPDHFAGAARIVADVDACTNLQEPDRKSPAEPRWRVLDDNDHHGDFSYSAAMS